MAGLIEPIAVLAFAGAAFVGALTYRRFRARKSPGLDPAKGVEAERIIALLSARQPGVWDQDDLRERALETARDLWTLPTREALGRLQTWVHPDLLAAVNRAWPARAARRELTARFLAPPAFVHVVEGGPEPDRLIARLEATWEGEWLDPQGRKLRHEKRPAHVTYHHWTHIDGQGWRLDGVEDAPPRDGRASSSVALRAMPEEATEEPHSPL